VKRGSGRVAALCFLRGGVGASSRFPGTFTADQAIEQIDEVFGRRPPDVLALSINCTGGSPAQAEAIFRYVRHLGSSYSIRTIAFVEDFATSAGYWIACGCREIYALDCSLIGSIGITTKSFEVGGLLKRFGVERRVYSDSAAKADLDMFSEHTPEAVERTKAVNKSLEGCFLESIKSSRGERLAIMQDELRTGRLWTGREAVAAGLVDGIADIRTFLQADEFSSFKLICPKPKRSKGLVSLGRLLLGG
jgi:ClpP class serine protease